MKLNTVSYTGSKSKEVEVALFDKVADPSIVAQAVRVYLSNQRQATAKTKTRAEVNLTKAKWFKQKGTGRARHGAKSAPIFVGGGVTHGPHGDRNWKLSMSKTMRKVALRTVFAMQSTAGKVSVVEGFDKVSGKTKEMALFINELMPKKKAVLIVTGSTNDLMLRALKNLENVMVVSAENVTTYFVARAHKVLITPEGLDALNARLADGKDVAKVDSEVATEIAEVKEVKKKVVRKTVAKKKEEGKE